MHRKVKIGLVGCGKISDAYFTGVRRYTILDLVACADLDLARAESKATQHGVQALTVEALLADPAIEIVVNLTVPQAHAALNERILRAGKHVYTEKPFALNSADCARVLALARRKHRLVGSAPDTFLGGGLQTARHLLDAGVIGRPVAAQAFFLYHGPETWHPSPEFYYLTGGGPMFDMGPYYLTALVHLLGPAVRVSGSTSRAFAERMITSQPLAGKKITVEVPTHYVGAVDFAAGATATVVMSFDAWPGATLPFLTLYGTEGTMEVPDPNHFDGVVRVRRAGDKELVEQTATHLAERGRGTGVADLAYAIRRSARAVRASGALAHHVVEVMEAFEKSSVSGRHVKIKTRGERPAPLPLGLAADVLDE